MFGKVTQNVLGKWETVLGKWSDLLGKWSKLLGKRSDLLGKWSKFDGEMKQLDGEMKQNVLGRCPIDKVHTTPPSHPSPSPSHPSPSPSPTPSSNYLSIFLEPRDLVWTRFHFRSTIKQTWKSTFISQWPISHVIVFVPGPEFDVAQTFISYLRSCNQVDI